MWGLVIDRRRNLKSYWKCNRRPECTGRMILDDNNYISSTPHTHPPQPADIVVHKSKISLKIRAATSDIPTKQLVADSVSGLNFECRSKLNCKISSLGRMARRSRQQSSSYSDVHKYFSMMGDMPFVPLGDVDMAWRYLKPLIPAEMMEFAD